MIRVRMRRNFLNTPRNDLLQSLIRTHNMLHRNTSHRQTVSDFLCRLINIHIVLQPFNGNLHSPASLELM